VNQAFSAVAYVRRAARIVAKPLVSRQLAHGSRLFVQSLAELEAAMANVARTLGLAQTVETRRARGKVVYPSSEGQRLAPEMRDLRSNALGVSRDASHNGRMAQSVAEQARLLRALADHIEDADTPLPAEVFAPLASAAPTDDLDQDRTWIAELARRAASSDVDDVTLEEAFQRSRT
jgi:hypothetical protein